MCSQRWGLLNISITTLRVSAKDSGTTLAEKLYMVLPVFEWTITFCSVSLLVATLKDQRLEVFGFISPSEKVYYTKDYY